MREQIRIACLKYILTIPISYLVHTSLEKKVNSGTMHAFEAKVFSCNKFTLIQNVVSSHSIFLEELPTIFSLNRSFTSSKSNFVKILWNVLRKNSVWVTQNTVKPSTVTSLIQSSANWQSCSGYLRHLQFCYSTWKTVIFLINTAQWDEFKYFFE